MTAPTSSTVTLADIRAAAQILSGRVHRTPLMSLSSYACGGPLLLKCENLQKIGAFKARGALHYLLRAQAEGLLEKGVGTYSSGNHAAAVAWAAAQVGCAATVFVPEDIPGSKAAAARGYGANVIPAGLTSADRRVAAEVAQRESGFHMVPPFDHPWIVAGAGTVGLEIAEECPHVRRVLIPVGGGGLLAGSTVALRSLIPTVEIVAIEPRDAASMGAAMAAGQPVDIELGKTIADGLRPVRVGELNCALALEHGVQSRSVDDAAIREAMRVLLERARLVVEPSGAAALGAYLSLDGLTSEGPTVAVLSGGNIDLARINELLG